MIDQSKVTSGFDVEFLMSEEFIRNFLLCSFETGSIQWWSQSSGVNEDNTPYHTATIIHPPQELQEHRLYPVHEEFAGREHPFQELVQTVYSFQSEEFHVTILPDNETRADVSVRVFPSVIDLLPMPPRLLLENIASIDLHIRFGVVSDPPRADGLLSNIGVQLELVDLSGPLIDTVVALGRSKESILDEMKAQIDRRVPFAVSGGASLQRIETRKFVGNEEGRPNAIGVYINLALQDGPEPGSLQLDPRGDVGLAQNFLEPGARMAFAFPPETYSRLANDLKFKMAVPHPGQPGVFHYPIMDAGEQVGVIKGISVYPERIAVANQPPAYTNVLVIDIHGEYTIENFFDPDFHMRIRLVPIEGANGVFDFDIDYDLDLSVAAYLVSFFLGVAVSFILPKLGLSLIVLLPLVLKIIERIGEGLARSAIEEQLDRASFLDTLPHKLTVESRRWDPLYSTLHGVETADVDIQVNHDGFAFDARDLYIGKRTIPVMDMVIRSETRDSTGTMDGLVYRANGLGSFLDNDIVNLFPATDRMPFVALLPSQGDIETHRVALTLEQVEARIAAKDRHIDDIDYIPKKVDLIDNQVFQILCVSSVEVREIENLSRSRLRNEIRSRDGAMLRQQAIDELQAELGHDPSEEEINARFDQLLTDAVRIAFGARFHVELDNRMKFDLEPHEFAHLQQKKILTLGRNHLEIRSTNRDGHAMVYYRDWERPFEPNTDKRDNLMSLPRYKHENA